MIKKKGIDFKRISLMIFDIETLPLTADIWRPGEQRVNHSQLSLHRDMTEIICITYIKNDGKGAQALVFEYGFEDSMTPMISEFDRLVKECDVVIGKNSSRFDTKHINTQRLMCGLPACPEWLDQHDDLETQMRRYFNMPSQSLDFWSKKFGLGGKIKMVWDDWQNIKNGHTLAILSNQMRNKKDISIVSQYLFKEIDPEKVINKGLRTLTKMVTYGKKDVKDTMALVKKLAPHVTFKHSMSNGDPLCCRRCGSDKVVETYQYQRGLTNYQYFDCIEGNHGAGKVPLTKAGTYKATSILR